MKFDPKMEKLWREYKTLRHGKLGHAIELNQRIKLFSMIYDEIKRLVHEIEKEAHNHINISTNEYFSLKIRQKISPFFTAIASNRDFYKENIITSIDGKINNILISQYNKHQETYNQLVTETIDSNNKFFLDFSNFLRNKLLHSNSPQYYGTFLSAINGKYNGELILDYHYIYSNFHKDKPKTSHLLHKYFIDEISYRLKSWSNHRSIFTMEPRVEERVKFTIINKLMQMGNTQTIAKQICHLIFNDLDTLRKYSRDSTFHLALYNLWKKRPEKELIIGQFMFNLSVALYDIYHLFNRFYEGTYNILLDAHKEDINRLVEIEDELLKFDNLPSDLKFNRAKLSIDIDYKSTLR